MKTVIVPQIAVTKQTFNCPECGTEYESRVDHLNIGSPGFGWGCSNEECDFQFQRVYRLQDGTVQLEMAPRTTRRSLVLLQLQTPVDGNPLYIVVCGYLHLNKDGAWENNDEYFYQEHTCPTNFVSVPALFLGTDNDPHGLFRHVQSVPWINETSLAERFPEFDDDRVHFTNLEYAQWRTIFSKLPDEIKDAGGRYLRWHQQQPAVLYNKPKSIPADYYEGQQ